MAFNPYAQLGSPPLQPSQGLIGQLTPQQMQQLGMLGTAPAYAQDPHSMMLQQMLAKMAQQPQGNAMGLGSNLLADALDQYALKRQQAPLQAQNGYSGPT